MTKIILMLSLLFSFNTIAEEVVKIEIGKKGKSYSQRDLERRVWLLERAVWQLQQRVFDLESKRPNAQQPPLPSNEWICTVSAKGNKYTGIGSSKAVAKHKAMNSCKEGNGGSAFFCDDAKCEK